MNSNVKLFIGNKEVEFLKEPDIFYNWTETDLRNPITTQNSFSKTITIEGTKNNNDIFGHYWNLERYQKYGGDVGQYFNASYKVPFSLYINGNLFEKGYIKLEKIKNINNKLNYEICLYGSLGNFLFNLTTNYVDGSVKTLADLTYYDNNDEELDLDFVISRDTVKEAWNNIDNDNSKWSTINFGSFYTGVPEEIDANKVLINTSGYPETIKTRVQDGSTTYETYNGWAMGETKDQLTQFEVKDLRSYLQVPVIRVKQIFNSLCRPINNRGQYDNGFEVELDEDFFNHKNPYYENTFITLPQIPKLNFNLAGTGSTTYRVTDHNFLHPNIPNTKYINFNLLNPIGSEGGRVKITLNPRVWVRDPIDGGGVGINPLYLMKQYQRNGRWEGLYRHGYAVQVYAISDDSPSTSIFNQTVLGGSEVYWYTDNDKTGYPFTFNASSAVPVVTGTGTKDVFGCWYHVEDGPTGQDPSLYGFMESQGGIVIETDLPAGTKQVRIWMEMCSETNSDESVIYQENNIDVTNYYAFPDIRYADSDEDWDGVAEVTDYGGVTVPDIENNTFYSYKRISKKMLLTTSYSVCDFLMSYCKMFGLYIYKDKSEDKIYITTRNNFYNRDKVEDLTGLIDISKGVTINPLFVDSKFITLTTPLEKTDFSEQYKNNYGVDYGMKKISTGFEFNADTKELIKSSLKSAVDCNKQSIYNFKSIDGINPYVFNQFKETLYKNGVIYDEDVDDATYDINIQKKKIASVYKHNTYNANYPYYDIIQHLDFENQRKPVSTEGVLVFYNGKKNVMDAEYHLTDDMTVMSTLNNKPCWIMTRVEHNSGNDFCYRVNELPLFSRYLITSASTGAVDSVILQSLDYGSPRELYVPGLINTPEADLYSKYYSRYYSDLFDVNTKVLECYIKPDKIFTELDMRYFYWFKNSIWRLNKITDYNPVSNSLVKCEFIKVQDLENITNVDISVLVKINVILNSYVIDAIGGTISGVVDVTNYGSWRVSGISGATASVVPNRGSGSTNITISIPEYTGYTDRTIQIEFKTEDDSQIVNITQKGIDGIDVKFYDREYPSTATTLTYHVFTSHNSTVTLYKDGVEVDDNQFSAGVYENETFTILPNTTNSAITYVLIGRTDDGTATSTDEVTQLAQELTFKWTDTNTSATTEIVGSASTTASKQFTTNMTGLIVNYSGCVESASITGDIVTANYTANPSTSAREGGVMVMNGSTVVGTFGIIQNGQEAYEKVYLPVVVRDSGGHQSGILNVIGVNGVDSGNLYNYNGYLEGIETPIEITLHNPTTTSAYTVSLTFDNQQGRGQMTLDSYDTGTQTNVRYLELSNVPINWQTTTGLTIDFSVTLLGAEEENSEEDSEENSDNE